MDNEGGLQNQPRPGDAAFRRHASTRNGISTILNDEQFHNPPTATDATVQRHATCRRDWPGGDATES